MYESEAIAYAVSMMLISVEVQATVTLLALRAEHVTALEISIDVLARLALTVQPMYCTVSSEFLALPMAPEAAPVSPEKVMATE